MTTTSGFDFGSAMRSVAQGLVVTPVLRTYLYDAKFPAFDLHFPAQEMERRPDDWFHPSTHPTLPARLLYFYLARPDDFPMETKEYMGTLSVTIGKVMHEFIQMCLTDAGLRPAHLQVCSICPPEYQCREAGVQDTEVGERGHLDGVLDLSGLRHLPPEHREPVFEFKTSKRERLIPVADMDLEAFRAKWPTYWAQQQRYMHLSGRRLSVAFFMATGHPWDMREFHIPYDWAWNEQVDAKYRAVRQAVADQRPPIECCATRTCPTASLCGLR